jgi:hypothetical protein
MPVVDLAKTETKRFVARSQAEPADSVAAPAIVWKTAWKTVALKRLLGSLARKQEQLLELLLNCDLSTIPTGDMKNMALLIDQLVSGEREILQGAHQLGLEIRAWWRSSLVRLSDQADHLDSIAESLHAACDLETTTLMAMAVEQFAMK